MGSMVSGEESHGTYRDCVLGTGEVLTVLSYVSYPFSRIHEKETLLYPY